VVDRRVVDVGVAVQRDGVERLGDDRVGLGELAELCLINKAGFRFLNPTCQLLKSNLE
ncbi:MAG: hypothetical protein GY797_19360, partial [Deltaproteobacteria bacterium]|nr:hypothetical protein [Deltaproteobacteria bacterium]